MQSGCLGRGYITPRQCVERLLVGLRTLHGCEHIIQRREHEFCLFIARVFSGPKETDGQSEVHALFVYIGHLRPSFHFELR